jgi:ribosomal protein S18 acetylase RimI-like enzyme
MENCILKDGMGNMDFEKITAMLSKTYWCPGIGIEEVRTGAYNSALNAGVFLEDGTQVAYARVVSDKVRFAYILDVIVDENCRKQGIGQKLIRFILEHPDLKDVYQWVLRTTDAQEFYGKIGFRQITNPLSFMEIRRERPKRQHS